MVRYLETLFRRRLIFVSPILLAVVVGGIVAVLQPKTYSASAAIWIDPPLVSDPTNNNPYITPAEKESDVLQALLATRSFAVQVGKASGLEDDLTRSSTASSASGGSSLSGLSALPGVGKILRGITGSSSSQPSQQVADDQVFQDISKHTTVAPAGSQIIVVTYDASSFDLAVPVTQSIVDAFSAMVLADKVAQLKAADDFYKPQVTTAQQDLAAADANVSQYLSQHPELRAQGAVPDATLASLNRADDVARTRYTDVSQQLQSVEIQLAAASAPGAAGFREIDQPVQPTHSLGSTTRLITTLGGSVGAGLLIGILAIVLLTLADRTLSVPSQLDGYELEMVGTIPHLPARKKAA